MISLRRVMQARVFLVVLVCVTTAGISISDPLVGESLFAGETRFSGKTIQVRVNRRDVQGTVLARSRQETFLLGRDGQLVRYSTAETPAPRAVHPQFRSYSHAELRGRLIREFGRDFDVTGTGHYLVVHPAGQEDKWAGRFETLYRAYVLYFSVRRSRVKPPQFPLVAIVFPDQNAFLSYARRSGAKIGRSVLGYYSPTTNRIIVYDVTAKRPNVPWTVNAETIIHEASHQMAFNTGLHDRFSESPRWVVEGLGTMFEAPGVWNSNAHKSRDSRINKSRLNGFRQYLNSTRTRGSLAQFISSDRMFSTNGRAAYGEAWALTFYLCETHHQKYQAYLTRVSSRPKFSRYSGPERLRDFTETFGANLALLEAHYLRFIEQL